MSVKLISVTPDAEKMMAYVARVSNPNNQENPNYAKLLGYCIKHNHWSVFEQAFMTLELETTRGVAAQVLRHRSFTYQEFSQRYADSSMLADKVPMFDLRRQDTKNRQNSIDDIDPFVKQEFEIKIRRHFDEAMVLYQSMLDSGNRKGMCSFCASFGNSNPYLHVWFLPLLDSLHQLEDRQRHSERAYGPCRGL